MGVLRYVAVSVVAATPAWAFPQHPCPVPKAGDYQLQLPNPVTGLVPDMVKRTRDGALVSIRGTDPKDCYQKYLAAGLQPLPPPTNPRDEIVKRLVAGITVTSINAPAVSGHYSLWGDGFNKLAPVAIFVAAFHEFPGGAQSYPVTDKSGQSHNFDPDTFLLFWKAAQDYAAKLETAAAQRQAWPMATVSIP